MREIAPGIWEGGNPGFPAALPAVVTMAQARQALLAAGILATVDTAIAAMSEPAKSEAQIAWEYSPYVRRNSAWVDMLGAALGLTAEQIDDLFAAAAAIP